MIIVNNQGICALFISTICNLTGEAQKGRKVDLCSALTPCAHWINNECFDLIFFDVVNYFMRGKIINKGHITKLQPRGHFRRKINFYNIGWVPIESKSVDLKKYVSGLPSFPEAMV